MCVCVCGGGGGGGGLYVCDFNFRIKTTLLYFQVASSRKHLVFQTVRNMYSIMQLIGVLLSLGILCCPILSKSGKNLYLFTCTQFCNN